MEGCAHEGAAKAEGCAHDGAAKAEGCAHDGAAKAEGCAHEATAKTVMAAYEDQASGCPFHSKASESQRAAILKGEKVTLVGTVICASCDLKQAKECKSLFKAEGGQMYSIVSNDAFEKLSTQTMHGEKKVEIVGTTAKDADESIVLLTSYKLIS